jgi:hypothetical protein
LRNSSNITKTLAMIKQTSGLSSQAKIRIVVSAFPSRKISQKFNN